MDTQGITPAAPVSHVLHRLRQGGFLAYPVGGCVRDLLLRRPVRDWDVATSARPGQALPLFERAYDTGAKHGTITVMVGRVPVEVTTFRAEGPYSDGRRPDWVRFADRLADDLARRDFTINAMAFDEDNRVVDLFGGQDDLKNRIIRCVGDPFARFSEDALRMWRALRFAGALGFGIERGSWDAIAACAPLCAQLSPERVAAEAQKMLLRGGGSRLADALQLGLMDAFLKARPTARLPLQRLKSLPRRYDCRWAALTALLSRAGSLGGEEGLEEGGEGGESFLRALRLPRRVIDPAAAGARLALSGALPSEDSAWRRLCWQRGIPAALCAAAAADALEGGRRYVHSLREVLRGGDCLSLKTLALSGGQLKEAGYEGVAIGAAQRQLMEHVLAHPQDNTPEALWHVLGGMRSE